MKNIKNILLFIAVLCACAACDKEEETALTALSLQGIRAEALPGAICLRWNTLENRDFRYATVSYYDFATQQTVSKLCSRYTDSLYVEGLLNRYGNYKFTFTTYDHHGTPGQSVYIERQCQKAVPYYVIAAENEIVLTAAQLATNAQEPSEGPIANLVDGNVETYFQSFWDEWTYPELKPAGYHYVTIDLQKEVLAFKFQHWNRKKGGSLPKTVNIYGGTGNEKWTLLRQLTNLPTDAGSSYASELFLVDAPISKIKYEVIKGSDEFQPYFSLAEIKCYEVVRKLIDPEAE